MMKTSVFVIIIIPFSFFLHPKRSLADKQENCTGMDPITSHLMSAAEKKTVFRIATVLGRARCVSE